MTALREQRRRLVDLLLLIPPAQSFDGRTSLLGEACLLALNRDQGNARLDLEGVVRQLEMLGAHSMLESLIENAAACVRGTAVAEELEAIRSAPAAVRPPSLPAEPLGDEAARLPPNNLPPRRAFVGREHELGAISTWVRGGDGISARPIATLYGLGGIGKTALALEYAYRSSANHPGGIWWLAAEGRPERALLRFAQELRLVAAEPISAVLGRVPLDAPAEQVVEGVRLALQNNPAPSLLVLDGVDEDGWAAAIPGGIVHVLITTRDRRLGLGERRSVAPIPLDDALDMVREIAGEPASDSEVGACRRAVSELGGLAVAVEAAAYAVKHWALSWAAYERCLRDGAVHEEAANAADYPRSVVAALELSINRSPAGSLERQLLEAGAAFAPGEIPLAWMFEAVGDAGDELRMSRAVGNLEGMGLVRMDGAKGTLSMHQLVRQHVRRTTSPDQWAAAARRSASVVAAWLTEAIDPARLADMADIDARRPHIEEALASAEKGRDDDLWLSIAQALARHLHNRGGHDEARALLERALAKIEARSPVQPVALLHTLSSLALLFVDIGRSDEALPLFERARGIAEDTYGFDHRKYATILAQLGATLMVAKRPSEALPLLEQARAIIEGSYGRHHGRYAAVLVSLAGALHDLGRLDEARRLLRQALETGKRAHGQYDPRTAVILSNLAVVQGKLGQPVKAAALLEKALAIAKRAFGPHHPEVDVITTMLRTIARAGEPEIVGEPAGLRTTRYLFWNDSYPTRQGKTDSDTLDAPPSFAGPGARQGEIVNGCYTLIRWMEERIVGSIFEAHDGRLDRRVALTLLHDGVERTPERRQRFLDWARAAARIKHPSLVALLDEGERRDGSIFLVHDLVRGISLRQHLRKGRCFAFLEALEIVVPIMGAVAAAHAGGIVHGDLTPEKIVFPPAANGRAGPMLVDLGVTAASVALAGLRDRTSAAHWSPYYIAPEQTRLSGDVGAPADVWTVGVILFELLAGRRPIEAPTPFMALERLASGEPLPTVTSVAEGVPQALGDIVTTALAREPSARFASMEAFLDAVVAFAGRHDRDFATRHAAAIQRVTEGPHPEGAAGRGRTRRKGSMQGEMLPDLCIPPTDAVTRAREALRINALEDAVARGHDAVSIRGVTDEQLGQTRLVQTIACRWLGRFAEAEQWARQAMERLPRGSRDWYEAAGQLATVCESLGKSDELHRVSADLDALARGGVIDTAHLITANQLAVALTRSGAIDEANRVLHRVAESAPRRAAHEPMLRAWIDVAGAVLAQYEGDLPAELRLRQDAIAGFVDANDARNACLQRANVANAYMQLGAYSQAEQLSREVLVVGDPMKLYLTGIVRANLSLVLTRLGDLKGACRVAAAAIEQSARQCHRRAEAIARLYNAEIKKASGDLKGAITEANRSIAAASGLLPLRAHALAVLAEVLLDAGRAAEALSRAAEAMDLLESVRVEEGESLIRLVHVRALLACGEGDLAARRARSAKRRLLERAQRIDDETWRASFLTNVPENVELLDLSVPASERGSPVA